MPKVSEFMPNLKKIYFDVDINTDETAFINPHLVHRYATLLPNADTKIESFFTTIMNQDMKKDTLTQIANISEENAAHLGYGNNSSRGHGPDKEITQGLILKFRQWFLEYPVLNELDHSGSKLMSLTLFVTKFSYDSISDLTLRIIEKELYEFTINLVKGTEYEKFVSDNGEEYKLTYWNSDENKWVDEKVKMGLYLDGKFTLLVPEPIVELTKFSHNPDQYINHVIIPRVIENETKTAKKITKKDITKREIDRAGSRKELIQESMKNYPEEFKEYLK